MRGGDAAFLSNYFEQLLSAGVDYAITSNQLFKCITCSCRIIQRALTRRIAEVQRFDRCRHRSIRTPSREPAPFSQLIDPAFFLVRPAGQ